MKAIDKLYIPTSALIFYRAEGTKGGSYVEHYDMDGNGNPINAHPLTVREAGQLAKSLTLAKEEKEPCLRPDGIIARNILYLDAVNAKAVWHTRAMQREMCFTEKLGIDKGIANVPPLLWMATRQSLYVYALRSNRRPVKGTKLYNAPFFNVFEKGNVCLGTVDVQISRSASLEVFTQKWESYFFNSYFSHLVGDYNPIRGNCVSLWNSLIGTTVPFPMEVLMESKVRLNDLTR
jgi:PRTRC genetic system protein B